MGALAKKTNQVHQGAKVIPFSPAKPRKVVRGEQAILSSLLALRKQDGQKGDEVGIKLNVLGALEADLLVDIRDRKYLEFLPDYEGKITKVFASKDAGTVLLRAYAGPEILSDSGRDKLKRLSRLAVELEVY